MIRRRFVNLVTQNHPRSNNGAYSLRRLDVAKHLFYPSTAEAEAAAANANVQSSGGGGKPPPKQQPAGINRLRRLPSPVVRFQQVPPTPKWRPLDDMFVLLSAAGGGGGTGGDRILHLHAGGKDGGGHGDVYDAESGSVVATVPSPVLDGPNRLGVQPITFSVDQSLYVMTDAGGRSFQRLDLTQHQHALEWQPLPPPPFAGRAGADDAASSITSFALVDGGSTICVSTAGKGTYCFDTGAGEWRRAGDWALPFDGRAHHVPELGGACLGFRSGGGERVVLEKYGHVGRYQDHNLCASTDLAAAAAAAAGDDGRAPPRLEHVWDDLLLPMDYEKRKLSRRRFGQFEIERWDEWRPYGYFPHGGHRLIDLGGGRFCVAKAFRLNHMRFYESDCPYCWSCTCEDSEDEPFDSQDVVVLAGVEVLRDAGDGGGGGGLRMVRHKSKRYDLTSDADEIKWCL